MQKIKFITGLLITLLLVWARPVYASSVSITQLPGCINYTDFKISCAALGGTAQFSSRKDGGSYTDFGSSINLSTTPCQVQVTGTQFGSEGKFWFKVTLNDGSFAETSTTLDTTGPSAVSDFGKDRMNGNTTYKIHWKNPPESDYTRVFIYRGEVGGFEADDSHKIAEAGGTPGDTMTWDNGGLDPNKEYFYAIRALDHANNSSSLAGDAGIITTTSTTTATPGSTSTRVTQLPAEGSGQILGSEATPTGSPVAASDIAEEPSAANTGIPNWIFTHKKITLGIFLALGLSWYFLRRRSK